MEKLFLVEMSDFSTQINLRAGIYEEILAEAEEYANNAGMHSVKVTPIDEVDGYQINLTKMPG